MTWNYVQNPNGPMTLTQRYGYSKVAIDTEPLHRWSYEVRRPGLICDTCNHLGMQQHLDSGHFKCPQCYARFIVS